MSLDGKQYFFVAYDYDTNYIFAIPIPDVKDETIIKAFDEIFTELTEKVTNLPLMSQITKQQSPSKHTSRKLDADGN